MDVVQSGKQSKNLFDTFIRVPAQLVVQFGSIGKRAWFLDTEKHEGDAAVLLITQPQCPHCLKLATILAHAQKEAMLKHSKVLMVYVLEVSPLDAKSQTVTRNMNAQRAPELFICKTSTGRLINWKEVSTVTQINIESIFRALSFE